MQARLIKGIQKPRPEFETVGACLIMLHGISDAGANFECWYVEFLGHQEQHLEFIDAAAAHMSAYDDNPRAQARAETKQAENDCFVQLYVGQVLQVPVGLYLISNKVQLFHCKTSY